MRLRPIDRPLPDPAQPVDEPPVATLSRLL
jgi:hypothetical protein